MVRFYYRRILGIFYILLSFIYTLYRLRTGLTLGDLFISISLMVLGVYLLRYKSKTSEKNTNKKM
ncbi:MAG: hypothetical protein VYD40_02955 [Chloroflexota bacterium]|nr:hypothetical protein [Chloroflexota bacterium]